MSLEDDLLSHHEPRRALAQHAAEVAEATAAILARGGDAGWRSRWGGELARDLAALHDLGKASSAFQRYIRDPRAWSGDPRSKAHSPLSLLLTAALAERGGWEAERAIAAALAVRGHHGQQPARGEELSSELGDDEAARCLEEQLASLDPRRIEQALGLALAPCGLEDPGLLDRARDALEGWLAAIRRRSPVEALAFRFTARAAYSVLLEADKAFLAVAHPAEYLQPARVALSAVDVEVHMRGLRATPLDGVRSSAGERATCGLASSRARLLTLSLPTGAGKTLIAARWALAEREAAAHHGPPPLIVIALPMLSIIEQTERVWRAVLGAERGAGATVLAAHSLADRSYDPELPSSVAEFYVDTWRSEVVVTTFDQLLLCLFSDKARHAIRYHRLLNARIVIDELQCIPPVLWRPVSAALATLCELGDSRVLAMSATPPRCIEDAAEVLEDPRALYQGLRRYRIALRHDRLRDVDTFVAEAARGLCANVRDGRKTLVTLNTRATAQRAWELLDERLVAEGLARPLLLSGDLTPRHRLEVIAAAQSMTGGVVVSTQCVEAGVDLDMNAVIRDLAPLDAIVQIAGRCNRHALRAEPEPVELVHLLGERGRDDAAIIYDEVLLDRTRQVLAGREVIEEAEVYDLCARYFELLAQSKDLGGSLIQDYAYVQVRDEARHLGANVRQLLRGDDRGQVELLVIEQDPGLEPLLAEALRIGDRWERRTALRRLASRIAAVTVSVREAIAGTLRCREVAPFRLLLPGQYHSMRGIDGR
jgi:CRISPR-associated endonuclease/helicase Cas3